MFAVVEQDVKGDGFRHDFINLRLDESVEISRWMLVIQVVSYLVFLPDHIKRVKLYCGVYSSAEKEEFGVWILQRDDGRVSYEISDFTPTDRTHTHLWWSDGPRKELRPVHHSKLQNEKSNCFRETQEYLPGKASDESYAETKKKSKDIRKLHFKSTTTSHS